MAQRGELGEREGMGREVLLQVERGRTEWGEYGKSTPPQKQLERKWKLETAAGTKLKRETGERRGVKFH